MSSSNADEASLSETKKRILRVVEDLFVESGYEGMSLRQISARAGVNLAAVHYHFGSKEALVQVLLAYRLDQMQAERIKLLERFESALPGDQLTCEHVLGAMFIPALRMSRSQDSAGGGDQTFLRFLGRVYTDPSPVVRDFLADHYTPVSNRFFEAFLQTLPHLTREELGCRLHFTMGALAGILAGNDTQRLIREFSAGAPSDDSHVIARLASLMVAALKSPMPDAGQLGLFASVFDDAGFTVAASGSTTAKKLPARKASRSVPPAKRAGHKNSSGEK